MNMGSSHHYKVGSHTESYLEVPGTQEATHFSRVWYSNPAISSPSNSFYSRKAIRFILSILFIPMGLQLHYVNRHE
ncbi:hypothetical protein VNO77_22810 [Canavalia gladiata]|uniref:Uncharacterized protein n=1 Tax=Canavalia gladiata TaxID=3824 RepID=A0AAN9L6L3_CANGL